MAWYRTGTIALTNGSAVINGSGTAWINNVQVGNAIYLPTGAWEEISAVTADGSLTLANPYSGATATGQGYAVMPNAGFAQYAAQLLSKFLTTYQGYLDGSLSGKFQSGTQAAPGIAFAGDQDTGFFLGGANTLAAVIGGIIAMVIAPDGVRIGGAKLYQGTAEFGSDLTGNRSVFIDLHGDDTYTDFASRFQRLGNGPDSDTLLAHRGAGNLMLQVLDTGALVFRTGTSNRLVIENGGTVRPGADGTQDFGNASLRWNNIRAAVGTIQTSDERDKQWRGALTANELAAAQEIAGEIGIYQWIKEIGVKGSDGARLHCGVRAQRVATILHAHELNPERYGCYCYDRWDETPAAPAVPAIYDAEAKLIQIAQPAQPAIPAGDAYGVRPDELLFFLFAGQDQRIAAIEAKLSA